MYSHVITCTCMLNFTVFKKPVQYHWIMHDTIFSKTLMFTWLVSQMTGSYYSAGSVTQTCHGHSPVCVIN